MPLLNCTTSVCKKITIPSPNKTFSTPNITVVVDIPTGLKVLSATVNYGTVAGNTWTITSLPAGEDGILDMCFNPADCNVEPTGKTGNVTISTTANEVNLDNNVIPFVLDYTTCGEIGGCGYLPGHFNVSIGTAQFKGVYMGSAPTISETATNGIYSIVESSNSSVMWLSFKGNADDVNVSGNLIFNYDNSANSTERRFDVTPFALVGGNADKPLNKFGTTDYVETQTVNTFVTSIIIPNLGGTGTTQSHTFALSIK
jgi:hypothetical protein